MNTKIVKVDADNLDIGAIKKAGQTIKNGGLVAFPTETVYGLGGNALDSMAAKKIYAAKGRPSDNPLIAHIASTDMLKELVTEIPPKAQALIEAFWPGPVTLIFKKSELVPKETTGGLSTVAVRYPNNPIALALIREAGVSIAAPSANLSGKPSPTLGSHVIEDMNGRIDVIIDGGMVGMGLESTIIDVTVDTPMILRPGFVTKEMIENVVGEVNVDPAILNKPTKDFQPKAPGMKYRHYAPKAEFIMYRGEIDAVSRCIIHEANKKAEAGFRAGIVTANQHMSNYQGKIHKDIKIISLGDLDKPETIAHALFKTLRDFDTNQTEYIFGETFQDDNVGAAIMNRLTKAAGYNIIDV